MHRPSPKKRKMRFLVKERAHLRQSLVVRYFDVLRIIKTCKFRQEREHDPRARHFSGSRGRLLHHGPRPRSRCTSTIFILLKRWEIEYTAAKFLDRETRFVRSLSAHEYASRPRSRHFRCSA